MKELLYDSSISFDMFSSYEIQLLFLKYLSNNELISNPIEQDDNCKLTISEDIRSIDIT